jgi:hypothetical protein
MCGAKMKKFMNYLLAINIFCAGVMLVVMIDQFEKGDTVGAILAALILVANLLVTLT